MMGRRLITFGMMALTGLAVALPLVLLRPVPAAAQFFPFFGNPAPVEAPKPPPDFSRAPAPKKAETPPTATIVVMGDSMADWLSYGLEDAFADTPEIGILRKHRAFSGLIRYEARSDLDWPRVARDILAAEKPAAVIMLLGLNDRQPIRERPGAKGAAPAEKQDQPDAESPDTRIIAPEQPRGASGSLEFRSEQWAEAYAKRIDDTVAALKSKGIPVIWVGLPPVRGPKAMGDVVYLNDIFRAQAEKNGIIFVDVWDGFVDETGKYSTYGPDVDGQTRSLRSGDGVYFTKFGARKLAHYVEREIRRVMSIKALPVALPSDYGIQAPGGARPGTPAQRPVAGAIVPLTATTVSATEELMGGGNPRPGSPDPTATRALVKGEPIVPLKGRADDFLWSGPGNSAAVPSTPDKPAEAAVAPPQESDAPKNAAVPPPAADPGKKPPAPGRQTKQDVPAADAERSQASATAAAAKKPQPAPQASRDVPRPPAPVGSSGFVNPFGSLFR